MTSPLVGAREDGFPPGLTWITREGEAQLDTGMDFGVARLREGQTIEEAPAGREAAWLLLQGEAELAWDGERASVARRSVFDEPPTVLHAGPGTRLAVRALGGGAEFVLVRALNGRAFAPRLFRPAELQPEYRGLGLVQNASLRNVRLVFDGAVRPESELVLGEVVSYPGRWSSYPPHTHPQPEIYHYRFTEPQGYGHAELGEQVFKVRSGDTLKITGGLSHAQVAAPGYGMFYVWAVRHLPGNRYTGFQFEEEHRWVLDPALQGWKPEGVPGL